MERIQRALQKAHAKRSGQPGDQAEARLRTEPQTAPPRRAPVATSAAEAAWEALERYEPDDALLTRNRILSRTRSLEATHFDILRTKIVQRMRDNSWLRLAVTSPGSACGKTTTSVNLAFSIARQAESRVILIEMDLRRPSMARILGLPAGKQQFSEVLTGNEPLDRHLLRIDDNIAVGTNASAVRSAPSELLQSDTMKTYLRTLEETYTPTIVLFDMPPMMVSDDVRGFADNIDAALLIAAAERTSMAEVDACERELSERTNVMGVVLNKCRYLGKEYGYDYYG